MEYLPLPHPALLRRHQLMASGFTASAIRHRIDTGQWIRLFYGIYLDTSATPDEQHWATMAAVVNRCGPGSAVSGKSAAALHRLDSTNGWASPIEVTQATLNATPLLPGVVIRRSRTVREDTLVTIDGHLVTSRARTVVDVLAHLNLVEGERVLESALRGPDPRRPNVWRTEVLVELSRIITAHPRQPGVSLLRRILAARPEGCLPTGSIAETATVQALRAAGISNVVRQARVVAPDEHGHPRVHFLDLFLPDYPLNLEIDGDTHLARAQRMADRARDRRVGQGIGVLRFTAAEALQQPERIVEVVRDEIRRRQHDLTERSARCELRYSTAGWTIVPIDHAA